jgi:hypothetical protein
LSSGAARTDTVNRGASTVGGMLARLTCHLR